MQLLNNYRPRSGLSPQRKIATIAKKLTQLNSCFISNFKILSQKKGPSVERALGFILGKQRQHTSS
jgi:hypothetical protein